MACPGWVAAMVQISFCCGLALGRQPPTENRLAPSKVKLVSVRYRQNDRYSPLRNSLLQLKAEAGRKF